MQDQYKHPARELFHSFDTTNYYKTLPIHVGNVKMTTIYLVET